MTISRPTSVVDCGGTKLEISQNELNGITLPAVHRTGSRPQQIRVYVRHALCLLVLFVHHTCSDCWMRFAIFSSILTRCPATIQDRRRVYRSFILCGKGRCQFLEEDLQISLPRVLGNLIYQSNTLAFQRTNNGELWQSLTSA